MLVKRWVRTVLVICGLSGTVHSSVTYEIGLCIAHAQKILRHDPILHAFFTPFARNANHAKKTLIGLIHSEQTKIRAALYRLTDKDVAEALRDARVRGVDVEVIIDSGGMRDRHSQISVLTTGHVPVFMYQKYYSIMHNKYVVFSNCLRDKRLVWTGSANLTHGGLLRNVENIIVVEDDRIFEVYMKDFERVKANILLRMHDHADS